MGLPLGVIMLLVVVVILLGSPVVSKVIELMFKRKSKSNTKPPILKNILHHPFFAFMDYCLEIRIRQLNFGTEFKNNVFHDLLYLRFKTFRDNLNEYILQYISTTVASNLFKTRITFVLYDSIKECEQRWRELNIPDIDYIIREVNCWHVIPVEFIQKYTQKALESSIYDNDLERLSAILDIYATAFEVILLDVESGLRDINGRFDGLSYQSKKV